MIAAIGVLVGALVAASAVCTWALSRHWERRYPPVGARVNLGPGSLHVVETKPKGAARGNVLLVHGASGNFADPHVALADKLAAVGFHVFAVDRPGHGYSDRLGRRRDAASPRRQAAWIRAALEAQGAGDAIVVVHSLAGVLGLAMALEAPTFTRGLVLLAPVSHPWKTGVSWYYTIAALPVVGALFRWLVVPLAGLALLKSGLWEVFAPNPVPPAYIRRTRLPLVFRPWQFRANAEDFVDLCAETEALSPRYPDIAAPTTIVMGAQDKLVSVDIHARRLERDIPGAILRLLPGVGHSPHFSAPEAVIEAIVETDTRAAERRLGLRETAPV